jgi:hypothetical protein
MGKASELFLLCVLVAYLYTAKGQESPDPELEMVEHGGALR